MRTCVSRGVWEFVARDAQNIKGYQRISGRRAGLHIVSLRDVKSSEKKHIYDEKLIGAEIKR